MAKLSSALFAAAATFFATGIVHAACTSDTERDDLTDEQIAAHYACVEGDMAAGYASGDNAWAAEYRSWGVATTQPGIAGTHGNRFVMTFVNDVGFDEYVKFAEEGVAMPVGTVIAKESFAVNKKLEVKPGPLFFMEKVAAGGEAEEFDNWVYSAVQPSGKPMGIKQSFCHDCHVVFEGQDALGYPGFDYRIASN